MYKMRFINAFLQIATAHNCPIPYKDGPRVANQKYLSPGVSRRWSSGINTLPSHIPKNQSFHLIPRLAIGLGILLS